jgi:Ca-activated chloride channel homolog
VTALVDLFANPWLLLLSPLALVAWWLARGAAGTVLFSSLDVLPAGGRTWRTALAWLPDVLFGVATLALVIAFAGPRKGDRDARVHRQGIAVMMAIDISSSMGALDLDEGASEKTRLDVVKEVFARFVNGDGKLPGRSDDAIGLVAFARYAETRSPLTLDHGNLVTAARELDFASGDDDGTAIGAGLELAVQRLAEFKRDDGAADVGKVIILLTDGVSNFHEIDEDAAIDDAVKAGVKVYTIGAGTKGTALQKVQTEDGRTRLVEVRVSIDEATLRRIADKTGGQYFRATNAEALEAIYGQIDRLHRTSLDEDMFLEYHQYFPYFVGLALALVTLAFLLRGTVLQRIP